MNKQNRSNDKTKEMTQRKYAVSVLVPVYNVEAYIEQCVRSLLEQTFQCIEYIFVDDASFDDSMSIVRQIVDAYPVRREDVRILTHANNRGLGQSRIEAINEALGDYILCVDSDDWLSCDAVEKLYSRAHTTRADIVAADFLLWYEDQKGLVLKYRPPVSPKDYFCQLLEKRIPSYLCNKLIRKELTKNLTLPVGINFMEDFAILPRLVYRATQIACVEEPLYFYRQRNSSYCHSLTVASLHSAFKAIETVCGFVGEQGREEEYGQALLLCRLQTKMMLFYSSPDSAGTIAQYYPDLVCCGLKSRFNFRERVLIRTMQSDYWTLAQYIVKVMKFTSQIKRLFKFCSLK